MANSKRPMKSLPRILAALALLAAAVLSPAWAGPWSFGVIGDTQWVGPDDGKNPNTVAADIIRQIDAEFIARGVRLVIAVGDTADKSSKKSLDTRALYAQDLYNAGIGFYPLRGNHDAAWADSGPEFARLFPQTADGIQNRTPPDVTAEALLPAADLAANPPAAKTGEPFATGSNFSTPATNAAYRSLSYSFDYANARFVMLDQFGGANGSSIAEQQEWIAQRLAASPDRPRQAFVFGHKNILGSAHKDSLFGYPSVSSDPGDSAPARQTELNRFLATLAQARVYYYISGHDHHHSEAVVTSPDGCSSVRQIIAASASSKFYGPRPPFSSRYRQERVDIDKIGFYICTVDGPRVTLDYYGVDIHDQLDGHNGIATTPPLAGRWEKISTISYTLEEAGNSLPAKK